MEISSNIAGITASPEKWELFTNRAYQAMVQRTAPERIYNVPGKPGIVYNFLEDAYEKAGADGYVITGAAGEMWPIGARSLAKYDIAPENVTDEPQPVMTIESDTVFAGIRIPSDTQFTLEVDYGEKAVLKGNRPDIDHGSGDWILVAAKLENGRYVPDFTDSGRVVNGALFEIIYKPYL